MLGSYPQASADIFSNVKLFRGQQSGPAPTRAGKPVYLGQVRPDSIKLGRGPPRGPLCAGASSLSEGAHSFTLTVG